MEVVVGEKYWAPKGRGVWRYASMLPVKNGVTMGEGQTPLVPSTLKPNLYVKYDGANPTGSFKDRGMQTIQKETELPFEEYIMNNKWQGRSIDVKSYWQFHAKSLENFEEFWASVAKELEWFKPWDKVLDASNPPFYKWFVGGRLNLSYLAVDRHVKTWRKNKLAIEWEGEPVDDAGYPTDRRKLTYYDLFREVNRVAW